MAAEWSDLSSLIWYAKSGAGVQQKMAYKIFTSGQSGGGTQSKWHWKFHKLLNCISCCRRWEEVGKEKKWNDKACHIEYAMKLIMYSRIIVILVIPTGLWIPKRRRLREDYRYRDVRIVPKWRYYAEHHLDFKSHANTKTTTTVEERRRRRSLWRNMKSPSS